MFVPISTGSPTTTEVARQDEPREMAVALRLLSGKDCERDASQAHVMLVRLSESRDATVASEAARILKAGAANRWFSEKTPKHYELERIAEKTLARRNTDDARRRQVLLVGIGLALLLGAGVAFFVGQDSPNTGLFAQSLVAILVLALLVGQVVYRMMKQRD